MTLGDYESYVTSAMFLDRPDPAAAWRDLGRRQAGLVEFMSRTRSIRIEADGHRHHALGRGPNLDQFGWSTQHALGGDIHRPRRKLGHGQAPMRFPVCRDGRELVGIELELHDGKVVSASADHGAGLSSAQCSTLTPDHAGLVSWAWANRGSIDLPVASFMTRRSGAPFISHSARATPRRAASTLPRCTGT